MHATQNKVNFASKQTFAILLFALGVCILGAASILAKLSSTDPMATAFYRLFFALPFIYLWLNITSKTRTDHIPLQAAVTLKDYSMLLLAGGLFAIDLSFFHAAMNHTTVANTNLFTNIVPFIIAPVSRLLFKKQVARIFWLGLSISAVGIGLLLIGKINPTLDNFYGDGLALTSALCYATYFLMIANYRNKFSAPMILFWSGIGGILVLIPLSLWLETAIIPMNGHDLIILIILGAFCHIGGQGLLTFAMGYLKTHISALLLLIQPIAAAGYAYLIFAEKMSSLEALGGLITLTGIYIAQRKS